jgi:hypothetical protein
MNVLTEPRDRAAEPLCREDQERRVINFETAGPAGHKDHVLGVGL